MIDNPADLGTIAGYIVLGLFLLFVFVAIVRAVRIVPHLLIPFVDRVRASVDLREQVVTFAPQPVITSDNLVVSIDTVLYFQVTDPKSAVYEIANYLFGIEQITVTTLRNVIGSMDLEQTLTSRDQINGQLRGVLDEATGRWGRHDLAPTLQETAGPDAWRVVLSDDLVVVGGGRLLAAEPVASTLARGHSTVVVRTPQFAELAELLDRSDLEIDVIDVIDQRLSIRGTTTATVSQIAFDHRIHLIEISETSRSLEEILLDMTGATAEYASA